MNVSRTAQYVAFYRALEDSERRRAPLFRDPFARGFLPRGLRLAIAASRIGVLRAALERYADRRAPGARTSAIFRTRFIDDAVRSAIDDGATQLVILGAGFDSRAHRLVLPPTRVFEVDRAPTQAAKRAGVSSSTREVHYVTVDFQKDDVLARLAATGWSEREKTVLVWEGVSNYLDEAAVRGVLGLVQRAPSGSTLVMTYIHRGAIDGSVSFEGAALLRESVRTLGEPWTFGATPEDIAALGRAHRLTVQRDLGADEYRRAYREAWEQARRAG